MPEKTYNNGVQDAWIEAIKENARVNMEQIQQQIRTLQVTVNDLSAKVNHIYGAATALGALAGAIVTVVSLVLRVLKL